MLRVITERKGSTYQLELHGMLGGSWVPVLEQHWRAIVRELPTAVVTILLSDVDYIDRDGERLIQRMAGDGVQFVATGCMNRYVIEKLQPQTKGEESWKL
jgi:hypothetical protein